MVVRREKVRRTVSVGGKQMNAATLGVCASNIVARHVQRLRVSIAKGARETIPSSRVSAVQMLAFVLLEPSDGKLSRSVPRGLGAGNRTWLPSFRS